VQPNSNDRLQADTPYLTVDRTGVGGDAIGVTQGATKEMAGRVIRRLRANGHAALLAGGCVRDMLLGRRPADYDVATSATPPQVRKLFGHVLMVGAQFGVAIVIEGRRKIEVASFRSDLAYTDGRRPDGVVFSDPRQDALRRDFTINGMFFDLVEGQVIDYVGGQADLSAGIIRAIGQPELRFAEDYLRMLRAVRFAARLGFAIDPATAAAIAQYADRIGRISGERIREELEKMFAHAAAAEAVERLHELGLLPAILPELFASPGLWDRARTRVAALGNKRDVLLTMAALLVELEPGQIRHIARRWGAANAVRESLVWFHEHLSNWQTLPSAPLAALKRLLAKPDYSRLAALWRLAEQAQTGRCRQCQAIARRARAIPRARIAPRPFVTGADLKELGLVEGPRLGKILAAIYEAQLNEQVGTRRDAVALARELAAAETNG
jgi:poly(A) polymerase